VFKLCRLAQSYVITVEQLQDRAKRPEPLGLSLRFHPVSATDQKTPVATAVRKAAAATAAGAGKPPKGSAQDRIFTLFQLLVRL
jgi:hypothetical protein